MQKMLNIGCGKRYHKDWVNIDVAPPTDDVIRVNIIKGLPFTDNSFDVVYHSNVLEHLPSQMGENMTLECYRILKPGGIIRINVPDLEKICNEYLNNMKNASTGNREAMYNYDWILIELFDQVSRNHSGGEMAAYLSQKNINNPEYLRKRLGSYFDNWRESLGQPRVKRTLWQKIKYAWKHPDEIRRIWHAMVLSEKEKNWLRIGKFRLSGEVHYQMYDQYSLNRLLTKVGFSQIEIKTPTESNIADWGKYGLDYTDDGAGLFVEAIKQ